MERVSTPKISQFNSNEDQKDHSTPSHHHTNEESPGIDTYYRYANRDGIISSQNKYLLKNMRHIFDKRKPNALAFSSARLDLDQRSGNVSLSHSQYLQIPTSRSSSTIKNVDGLSSLSTSSNIGTINTVNKSFLPGIKKIKLDNIISNSPNTTREIRLPSLENNEFKRMPSEFTLRTEKNLISSPKGKQSNKQTFSPDEKSKESDYYIAGLRDYFNKNEKEHKIYYQHLTKSFNALRELKNDRCTSDIQLSDLTPFRRSQKLVLALDLDETLIHCCNFDKPGSGQYQCVVNYKSNGDKLISAKLNIRPHLRAFLDEVSKHYDIVIYTASDRDYATAVVNLIDPQRKYIRDIYHRDHCFTTRKGFVVKDLRVILPNETDRIVLVDNSSQCFAPQISNGIPIIPFTYNKNDTELLKLGVFLLNLKGQQNILGYLEKSFKMKQYTKFMNQDSLLEYLVMN